MLDAVFFDGDQTLWDFDMSMRRALQATLYELRLRCPGPATDGLDVEALVADRQAVGVESGGSGTMEELRHAAFERTLTRLRLPAGELAEQLTGFYLEQRFSAIDLYPDSLTGLSALDTTYKIGLLSNGNTYPDRFGLTGVFAAVVFAAEHQVAKPDRRLFDIAAEKVGSPAAAIAMVGDSLTNDVAGAQQAGWRGIWLNRDRRPCPPDQHPDAEIATLAELPAVLAEFR